MKTRLAAIVGLCGVLAALALPFAPVIAEEATVTWPAAGKPMTPSTAFFVPYRPAELTVAVPCRALLDKDGRVAVATGPVGNGLVIRTDVSGPVVVLRGRSVPLAPIDDGDGCRITVNADRDGVTVSGGSAGPVELPGEPVPEVFYFHTDLTPAKASGISVTARTASVFATSPTTVKVVLIVVQLLAAAIALAILVRRVRIRRPRGITWRLAGVDAAVILVLIGWAVIGPLAVDDGWATMIARTYAATGEAGNYYRWWNASETPFAFWEQLLAPLTKVSLQPLWLRLPSTLLAVATWFVVSRGVLGAALPGRSRTVCVRVLAAVCMLVAWLPFNLGTRPESYVALGVTSLLAVLWRTQGPAGLGWAALVVALTVPISPTSVVMGAPLIIFVPHITRVLWTTSNGKVELATRVLLLCCILAVGMTIVFADATWDALVTATDWHNFFGPSLPWYREPDRYQYLFGPGQQGSFAKRMPIALVIAMLPIVGLTYARSAQRNDISRAAARLAAVIVAAVLLLGLVPSKWSYHLGAMAGLFAAFLAVAVVMVVDQASDAAANRLRTMIGLAGGLLVAAATAFAFSGPNAWWLQSLYRVPWELGGIRPEGVPLSSPMLWVSVLVVLLVILTVFTSGPVSIRITRASIVGPAVLAALAAGTAVAVLLVSFVSAPLRRPSGSLATANLRWLSGRSACGLADDVEVLTDVSAGGRDSVVRLSTFLLAHRPVLLDWPVSFVFPCVRDVPMVSHGLAQAPSSMILSPPPWRNIPTESIGATFAALDMSDRPYEVPTRVIGPVEIDWGSLLVSGDPSTRDAYAVTITHVRRPGHIADRRPYQIALPE